MEVPPGAEIPWLWWGLSCQRRQSGVLHQALFEDITQVVAHSASIDSRQSSGPSAQRAFDVSDAVVNIVSLAGISTAAFLSGPLAIGGISMTAWWSTRKLAGKVRSRQERRARSRDGFLVDTDHQGRDDELAELAGSVAKLSSQVPLVMVIDDAHWADKTLVAFLQHLARDKTSRALVVATQWPQADAAPWENFRSAVGCVIHDLNALEDSAVRALVRSEYQRVARSDLPIDETIVDRIVERLGSSPMAIRALFGIERTRRMIEQRSLTASETNWIPRDLKSVLSLYWEELPSEVREVLAIAALAGSRFPNPPVLEAAQTQGIEDPASLLVRSHQPFGYVKPVSEFVHWFTDPIFHSVAFEEAQDQLTPDEITRVHEILAVFAQSSNPDDPAAEIAWAIHVELAEQGHVDPLAAAASAVMIAKSLFAQFDFDTAFAMLDRAQKWNPDPQHEDNLQARMVRLDLLIESGSIKEAISMAEGLLLNLREAVGDDHPATLSARSQLAYSLGAAGRVEDAVAAFEQLLVDTARVLGDDHPDTFRTRHNLAYFLGELGRVDESIEALEQVLVDRRRVLGDDHPDTLRARGGLAVWLVRAGRLDEAIKASEELLADRRRVLGDYHPETLDGRSYLARSLAEVGRLDEAIAAFEQLLIDGRRVFGDDHPQVFKFRGELEGWRRQKSLGEAWPEGND